ncbi:30 kDa heat shock protein [Xylaria palmicola]|nr:30 kDa heat shock protein [Xylaria palmicola]
MSVFTHHPFYTYNNNNDFGNFGGLVRFIDDWDKHFSSQQKGGQDKAGQPHQGRRGGGNMPTFTPRFDVKETEQSYELHGELPGVDKKNVNIEFSDAQTIVIRGNVERTYREGNPPAGLLGDASSMTGAIANEPHSEEGGDDQHRRSLHATVEDEGGDAGNKSLSSSSSAAHAAGGGESAQQQQQPREKYWVYERSVGNFTRSFTFSNRVDHEGVSASLDNGILTVVVPKAKKPETRRITVH